MYLKNYFIQVAKNILIRFPKRVMRLFEYFVEFVRFRKMSKPRAKPLLKDAWPCLKDKIQQTPFDHHYTYHPAWAARIVAQISPAEHVDISSILYFGTMLSAFVPVKFYDYRPAAIDLKGYNSGFADLKQLPFESNSIESLSCMHTVEHIGLGRYGDELDPEGDLKAIAELKRVIKPGGNFLFVTPVGMPKVQFNGQRVYSFEQVVEYFHPLELNNFSLVPDKGGFIENADPNLVANQQYGCGCFWFKKNPG